MSRPTIDSLIAQAWNRPAPEGLVRYWTDDEQGGGWLDWVTPQEAARRDAEERETNSNTPAFVACSS